MSIVKRGGVGAALSEPASPVGKSLVTIGGGALAVTFIAALLPFGILFWAIAAIVLGIFVI